MTASAGPAPKCIPFIRRVTELPPLCDFARDAALLQILSGRLANIALEQILLKPFRRFGVQLQQLAARFVLSIFLERAARLNHRNPGPCSELAHCRRKINVLIIHHETEDAPARTAPEAMKSLAAWAHRE